MPLPYKDCVCHIRPIINDEWNKKRGTRSRLIITFCEQRVKYPRRHTFSKEEKNVNDPIKQILYHINIRTSLFIFYSFLRGSSTRQDYAEIVLHSNGRPGRLNFNPWDIRGAANEKGKITFSGFLSRSDEWPQFPYRNWINRLKRGTARTARALSMRILRNHIVQSPTFSFGQSGFSRVTRVQKKERKLARNFFFSWRGISVKKCLFGGAIFENYMPLNEGARARESPSFKSGGNAFSASPAR